MYYGIIPATIRHNPLLSSTTKLIYCEITSLADKAGLISLTKGKYDAIGDYYNVEKRTVMRALDELEEAGVIAVVSKDVRTGNRVYSISINPTVLGVEEPPSTKEEIIESRQCHEEIVNYWNKLYSTNFKCFDTRKSHINARLESFTKEEILKSIENRYKAVSSDAWWNKPENIKYKTNIDTFITSDSKIDKYLQIKEEAKPSEQIIKRIKFE